MKLAVCAQGQGMEAPVDTRFGRCRYFVIVDLDNNTTESSQNPAQGAAGGAGIQAAQFVANAGVDALLTGNVGPNAASVVLTSGMKVYTGIHGTVEDSVQSYNDGKLTEIESATVGPHYGGGRGGGRRKR